jgi:hypothetical protein
VSAWRPLRRPSRSSGRGAGPAAAVSPFARLARTHAFMVAGDTLVAVALAGSLFFSISPDAARGRVVLYLLLTMAPFAVVAPLIGPAIDRRAGGRRLMVIVSAAGRAAMCLFLIDDIDGLLLFPEAFAVLVLAKGYAVAKSALVPGLVRDESALVEANSKLTLVSGIVGLLAGLPGAAVLQLAGPGWVIGLAMVAFTCAAVAATRLPGIAVGSGDAKGPAVPLPIGVVLAGSAMGVLRAVVGFLTFLLAFELRDAGAPAWWFGVVLAASAGGSLAGAVVAPRLRRTVHEEALLAGSLVAVAAGALAVTQMGGLMGATVLATTVGVVASGGKQAFDAIVQRDAPERDQASAFARFETRFQLVWVVGALVPVAVPVVIDLPLGLGYALIAGATAVAAGTYIAGLRAVRHRPHVMPRPLTARLRDAWAERARGRKGGRGGEGAGAGGHAHQERVDPPAPG